MVDAIYHHHKNRNTSPLVILARRGYGKSSALGIATAQILTQNKIHIIITAPRRSAVDKAFEQAAQGLNIHLEARQTLLNYDKSLVEFIAPDELIRAPRNVSLLMIDEAAAIPVSMLQQLLKLYPSIVISSTTYGYEGHGSGFEIQFLKHLSKQYPDLKSIKLNQPERWGKSDPLEELSAQLFLYYNKPLTVNKLDPVNLDAITMHKFDKQRLLSAESDFNKLFGLLNTAHYKTSPDDLRIMFDSPFIQIFYLQHLQDIIACALIVYEGNLPEEIARKVIFGERRIHGHLIPQSLLADHPDPGIATAKFVRIMRIAVIPEIQQMGVGSVFLEKLKAHHNDMDYIGASFGADTDLIGFWEKAGYSILKLGRKSNAYTGRYPLLMLQALSDSRIVTLDTLQSSYADKLLYLLSDSLKSIPYQLVISLLSHLSDHQMIKISQSQLEEITLFSHSHRQYDSSVAAVHLFVMKAIQAGLLSHLSPILQSMLIQKFIQKRSDKYVIGYHKISGKTELIEQLREGVKLLLKAYPLNQAIE